MTLLKQDSSLSSNLESEYPQNVLESALCSLSPHYFLTKYAWIQDRNTGKKIKWQPWPYLLDLLTILEIYKVTNIAKARQLGITWTLAGWSDQKVNFKGDNVLGSLLSQGEKDAWKFLDKCKFIYRNLPDYLRREENHTDAREVLDFKDVNSRLEALPSTPKAGRGTDATFVIRDEVDFHPYAKENHSAISPGVDAGAAKLANLSTFDPWDADSHFTGLVNRALEGTQKYTYPSGLELYTKEGSSTAVVFLGWKLRPVRDEGLTLQQWWDLRIVPNYDKFEREKEYPETLEQALASPLSICRFDKDKLPVLKSLIRPSLNIPELNKIRVEQDKTPYPYYNGRVRIWKEPQVGLRYILAVDPSEGIEDPSAGIVVDWKTCEKVADYTGKISSEEQGAICHDLYEIYNQPFTGVEINKASGVNIIKKMEAMGDKNLYHHKKDEAGWWTSSKVRPVMIETLAEMVRDLAFIEPAQDALNQFYNFIITDRKPQGEARGKTHDDFVMTWAIFFQLREHMPIKAAPLKMYEIKRDY